MNSIKIVLLVLSFVFSCVNAGFAQTSDSTNTKKIFEPKPKKAALYSAILPGMGQAYNRQYWKIPVIYAGVGVSGYFLIFNANQYQKYRKIYIARLQGDNSDDMPYYSNDNIKTLQDAYKKYLDMTVLLTALGYTIQMADALAAAHLRNFDVSPNISMRLQPVMTPIGPGIGLVAHF
jgi:hypothetical protein